MTRGRRKRHGGSERQRIGIVPVCGIGLIERIRVRPGARLPTVVVSMRGSDSDKARAMEAGADAYLVKTDFSHKGLWAMVARFLE